MTLRADGRAGGHGSHIHDGSLAAPRAARVIPHARDAFVLADGRRTERDIGRTWVRIDGRAEMTLFVFGDLDAPVLLGAYTLEGLRLAADPVSRRLISVPGLLLALG